MECYCCLRNVQDLLADGKTPYERRFGEPFEKARSFRWVHWLNIIRFLLRTSQGSTQFGEGPERACVQTPTDKIDRWRWSLQKFLVYSGRFRSTVITLNREFNFMCQKKKHFLFHWFFLMPQGQLDQIKTFLWLLERRWKRKFVRFADRLREVHSIEVQEETDNNWDDDTSRSFLAWTLGQFLGKPLKEKKKTRMGTRKAKTRECQKFAGIYSIDPSDEDYKDII